MKKNLLLILLPLTLIVASCRQEALQHADTDQQTNNSTGTTAKGDDDTDAAYCTCYPCNTNVSWNNACAELNPKMHCWWEGCSGFLYDLSTRFNYQDKVFDTSSPAGLISLARQADIIQKAIQKAQQYRPAGKIISKIELFCDALTCGCSYIIVPKITYARCSPDDVED